MVSGEDESVGTGGVAGSSGGCGSGGWAEEVSGAGANYGGLCPSCSVRVTARSKFVVRNASVGRGAAGLSEGGDDVAGEFGADGSSGSEAGAVCCESEDVSEWYVVAV